MTEDEKRRIDVISEKIVIGRRLRHAEAEVVSARIDLERLRYDFRKMFQFS